MDDLSLCDTRCCSATWVFSIISVNQSSTALVWTNLALRLKCLNESLQTHTLHWDILSPKKFTSEIHKESGSQQEITAVIDTTLLSIFNRVKQKFPFNHSFTQSSATARSVCVCVPVCKLHHPSLSPIAVYNGFDVCSVWVAVWVKATPKWARV